MSHIYEIAEAIAEGFTGGKCRELELGEKIEEGDVFVQNNKAHPATDTGTGFYSTHHFLHFRRLQ